MRTDVTIVGDSISPHGERLISVLCTFPRIILAEVNTHRMLSKNTSSSRAIPFDQMVNAVQEDPFIPIAFQRRHHGMQGKEYLITDHDITKAKECWLKSRDNAINEAKKLHNDIGVTKQLANRLLEPYMWTTMLITGNLESWQNLFDLRCPLYEYEPDDKFFKSKKEWLKYANIYEGTRPTLEKDIDWFYINKGQAEIHFMDLAEKIYDAVNESIPKKLQPGEWHIPYEEQIEQDKLIRTIKKMKIPILDESDIQSLKAQISIGMAARTSYTIIEKDANITYQQLINIYDKCKKFKHSSVFEHCAKVMTNEEYNSYTKTFYIEDYEDRYYKVKRTEEGWCRNFKGFIQYRHLIDL